MARRQTAWSKVARVLNTAGALLLLLWAASAGGQSSYSWVASYGGLEDEHAWVVEATEDGEYAVAGWTQSFGVIEVGAWVVKLREDGTVRWQKVYNEREECASFVQETSDGGLALAGLSSSGAGGYDFWVMKLRDDGSIEWQNAYGGSEDDQASCIRRTSDGGYVVAGETQSFGEGDWDIWILKLDASGAIQWQKTYGGSGVDTSSAEPIVQTTDGGYAVCGRTESFGAGAGDFFVFKLRADGSVEWQRSYGGADYDYAHAIRQTTDGGYVVAGDTMSFGAGDSDVWVVKLDPSGAIQWQKAFGGGGTDQAWSIQTTADGGYVIGGATESFGAGDSDGWIVKLRADGSVLWQRTVGGEDTDVACSVRPTSDGGVIAVDSTASFGGGGDDFLVVKLDAEGVIPGCDLVGNAPGTATGTNATTTVTRAKVASSDALVVRTHVVPRDTEGSVDRQCFSAEFTPREPRRHVHPR